MTVIDGVRSLVNKETALAHLIDQPLGGWSRQKRMLGGSEADAMPLLSELDTMKLQPKMDVH